MSTQGVIDMTMDGAMTVSRGKLAGATLLVVGTCIGAGTLGLPVITSPAGFLPAVAIYFLCWLFMVSTGLIFVEIYLWNDDDTNIVSMAESTLGFAGKAIAWVLYLLLFYNLTIAYIAESGIVFAEVTDDFISPGVGTLLFVGMLSPLVYLGAGAVNRMNIWLMLGLAFSYFAFVALGSTYVDLSRLDYRNWSAVTLSWPLVFVSFGFQGTVPTLTCYLEKDHKATRFAIIVGSFLTFIAYVLWEALILGIVPLEGANGLTEALNRGETAIRSLRLVTQSPWVSLCSEFFAFFALVSSFLGVTLGLLDFLADGLSIKKTPAGKLFLCALIFIPPTIVAFTDPSVFFTALKYAGGFGCALLLGLLPIIMVWIGRYRQNRQGPYRFFANRILLVLLAIFVSTEVVFEMLRLIS